MEERPKKIRSAQGECPHPRGRGPPRGTGYFRVSKPYPRHQAAVSKQTERRKRATTDVTNEQAATGTHTGCVGTLGRGARPRWILEAGGRFVAQRSAVHQR